MKNIHILPTDKPSRFVIYENNDFILLNRYEPNWIETNFNTTNQHIYITSDEEIKEGDWIFDIVTKKIEIAKFNHNDLKRDWKKIILTTDQDLIKDGVQAIDDEFLEWICKNPSCEEVFLTNDFEQVNQDNPILRGSTNVVHKYKIIIPKEEPKKNWYCAKCESYVSSESVTFEETHQICNTGVIVKEEPKQSIKDRIMSETSEETKQKARDYANSLVEKQEPVFENAKLILRKHILKNKEQVIKDLDEMRKLSNEQEILEEVAERYSANELSQLGFINGAKWQEQQTIEEVFEWLTTNNYLTDLKETLIENFKNR